MEWIVQLGFELDIYQVDELAGMYWYVLPVNTSRSRPTDLIEFLGLRYLQHLASTRLQHLDRIRVFTNRASALILKPSPKQSSSFARSFSFLDLAMLEASAIQNLADGLACVGNLQIVVVFSGLHIVESGLLTSIYQLFSCLAHLDLIPSPTQSYPYGTPSLRYSLRMRPFLSVSLPEVPSYEDFSSLVFLQNGESARPNTDSSVEEHQEHALSILDVSEQAMKVARREWEAMGKQSPEAARYQGCEDWWRSSIRDVVRASIAGSIAVATARKGVMAWEGKDLKDVLSVEIPDPAKRYHPWWVIPRVSLQPKP